MAEAHMLVSFIPDPQDPDRYAVKVTHQAGALCDAEKARLLGHLAEHYAARHHADTCRDSTAHAPAFIFPDRTA